MAVRARIRGIYATALTRLLLDAGHEVVQASPPICRRFDAELPAADHDVDVTTTADRQGVGVAGDSDAVATLRSLLLDGTATDAFAWPSPAPHGAVFDARVVGTVGGGAVVDLGETEGYLPFRNADDRIDEGDAVRVRVAEDAAPWVDDRPFLDTQMRVDAGLASLVRGTSGVTVDARDDAAGRELAGMTDLLPTDPPEGWGIEWSRDAADADMNALDASLSRAVDRAADLAAALDNPVEPVRRLAAPSAGVWAWFGRDARFALDARRREVTDTMAGHHRIKAASEAASAGVDFAEAVCVASLPAAGDADDFPFAAVTEQFGPVEGDTVTIRHGKPDGRLIVLGRGEVVEWDADGTVAVERSLSGGGTYDALGVPRSDGDVARTKFREGRWWYPTVYRGADGERKGTYVNVCTPVEVFPDGVRYVDLHVDVIKHPDGVVERVDDDELDAAVTAGDVTEGLAEKARSVATSLENAL